MTIAASPNSVVDGTFATSLLVLSCALTAVSTAVAVLLPLASESVPFGVVLDLVPFASTLASAAIVTRLVRRENAGYRARGWLLAAYFYWSGALIASLGVAHLAAVLANGLQQAQFVYTFRLYSLILLGVLLGTGGSVAALQAVPLARGEHSARRASLGAWAAILAINVPLVSLQTFAILFSVLAVGALCLLAGDRSRISATTRPPGL